MTDVRIEPFSVAAREEVLDVINRAFEFPRSADWFTWKHLDGPWGPSRGVVAADDRGIVGVRLLLPWRFERLGEQVVAYRAVEASTLPRARGRGVFSRLNRALMEEVRAEPSAAFIFSTPNALSRDGYRKLGWTWLDPIPHRYRLAPRTARSVRELLHGADALATYQARPELAPRVATAWTSASLRWRLDARSGNEYQAVATTSTDEPAGVAYRMVDRGRPRILLEVTAWGARRDRDRILGEACRRERAHVVLAAVPAWVRAGAVSFRRGGSLLAYWSPDERLERGWRLEDTGSWGVTFSDLESVL